MLNPTRCGNLIACVFLALVVSLASACGTDDHHHNGHHHNGDHHHDGHGEGPRTVLSLEERYQVSYEPAPDPVPLNELFDVLIEIREAAEPHHPVTDAVLAAFDATMPGHGHGMNVEPTIENLGDGRFRAEGLLFHMGGHWHIDVEVDGPEGEDLATFHLDCCH